MAYFIDVILPIPLQRLFTYSISEAESQFLQQGMRVAVPFGKSKVYTALVYKIHQTAPEVYEAKEIQQILDEQPIITKQQLKHWEWIASYYMASLGEVFRSAVPSAFLLESETVISKNDTTEVDENQLKDDEFLIYEALQHQALLKIQEISSIIGKKKVLPVLKGLIDKKIIQVHEEIYEQYKPKLVRYIKLHPNYSSEESLQQLLESLNRAKKQREVILKLFSLVAATKRPISVKELTKESQASSSVIKTLIAKEILSTYYIQKDRIQYNGEETVSSKELNQYQQKAYQTIKTAFKTQDVCLLYGITSSGKTEVYVKLIEEVLETGKQVLYLLPEIALTTQLISRLQQYFGERVAIYHSKYSVHERVEVWNNVLGNKSKAQIVLGARSSLLLPFSKLGLIIVDEEHETSFKQYDPAPRYHARDAAIVLAKLHQGKIILGSATPSVESYYNATTGKYALATITRRFGDVLLPDMELVDIKEKHRKKRMKGHFSDRLLEEIEETLSNDEQIILFQNRRGYAPIIECNTCGHSPQCPNCDVSLTFHQYKNQLRCHYCSYHIAMQQQCMACGSHELDSKGFGTQQIEEELSELLPNIKVGRMDLDTTRGKYGYQKIISAFEQQEIQILVGTQMLTKGLDFRNVTLVGIMNADRMLNFPDFRAHERSFQLIQQVAGRAGRTKKRGKVIVQTYHPYHQILQQVSVSDYDGMFTDQLNDRRQFHYPPFYRLIKITVKHKEYNRVNESATWFAKSLRNNFGENVLGPEFPPVARIRNLYLKHILLKIPKHQSLAQTKEVIMRIKNTFLSIANYRSVRVIIDVDTI